MIKAALKLKFSSISDGNASSARLECIEFKQRVTFGNVILWFLLIDGRSFLNLIFEKLPIKFA